MMVPSVPTKTLRARKALTIATPSSNTLGIRVSSQSCHKHLLCQFAIQGVSRVTDTEHPRRGKARLMQAGDFLTGMKPEFLQTTLITILERRAEAD